MKALTLIRPWAWVLFNGKPIENRSWPLPDRYLGEPIAIHAGRKWDRDGAEFVYRMLGPASTLPAAVEAEVRRQLEAPSLGRCLACSEGVLDARLGGMCGDCEASHG